MGKRSRQRRTRGALRLFVAADPPGEVRDEVAAWGHHVARSTAGLRAVPAENCHITLAFIGDRAETDLEATRLAIREAAGSRPGPVAPAISLGAPIWLPPHRPRALALEIHDDRSELARLRQALAAALEAGIGWKTRRRFRPHLTTIRSGRGFDSTRLRLPRSPSIGFEPEAITLYSSVLLPEGARYEPLERIGLAGCRLESEWTSRERPFDGR